MKAVSIVLRCVLCTMLLVLPALVRAEAWLIDVTGAIGPATADHMLRGLQQASEENAPLVILRIDTPGGLDTAMRDMIRGILAADIPVVGYVSPSGARAASAGTYLLYSAHIAAMAPATNLGAATPVQIGSPGLPALPDAQDSPDASEGVQPGTAMERKIVNDAVAYIQSLAQLRGRNSEWAERAVREGASLSAEDAFAEGVIDIVAADTQDLLAQLDGRQVSVANNTVTLATNGMALRTHALDWRSEFLAVITNPNVAYILMLVGIYGLLIEFYNPGIGLPGVLGSICLLLALYAFQALPVSYAGVGLIALGIVLMASEAVVPSFGVLGLGGIAAFVVGSIMLMDTDVPAYQIALPTIIAVAAFSGALLVFGLGLLLRARHGAVVSGVEHLSGAVGVVESISRDGSPMVRLEGELWQGACDQPVAVGDAVVVRALHGLILTVEKYGAQRPGSSCNV